MNIWQWKAALEAEARSSEGAIPYNGTRNLTSNGICRAVDTDGVRPVANSTWRDGRWYVIYTRALAASDEGTAPLLVGTTTNAAFAVWDGGKGETRAMKAVSTWTPVTVGNAPATTLGDLLTMGFLIVIGVIVVVLGLRLCPGGRTGCGSWLVARTTWPWLVAVTLALTRGEKDGRAQAGEELSGSGCLAEGEVLEPVGRMTPQRPGRERSFTADQPGAARGGFGALEYCRGPGARIPPRISSPPQYCTWLPL